MRTKKGAFRFFPYPASRVFMLETSYASGYKKNGNRGTGVWGMWLYTFILTSMIHIPYRHTLNSSLQVLRASQKS